jgi:acetylornithine aminotransferase/acetylornithine/N-succinyldiaminopimelate aminotransferase
MNNFQLIKERADQVLLGVYARFPVAFARGRGVEIFDVDGKRYLDFAGGIAVNSLGHAHPRIVETLHSQASALIHISNLYYNEPQVRLAERLIKLFGQGRCFFPNSGAEANEALFKLARKYGGESRYEILTAVNSFHGRTLAAIAATGQEKVKTGFYPMVPGFRHIPFNDLEAAVAAISPETAAIMIEGIQGEGGITPATPEYLLGLRKLCDERGLLLFVDAVQCGHYRTGRFQSYERILEGVDEQFKPDAVSFAKSLGGGFPIGGVWISDRYHSLFGPGSHGTTFGGSPLACAVANTVLDVIEEERLAENARTRGEELKKRLGSLSALREVRGLGCMLGLELEDNSALVHEKLTPAQVVINRLLERGLLAVPSGNQVVRLLPPLNISAAEVEEGVGIITEVLESCQ